VPTVAVRLPGLVTVTVLPVEVPPGSRQPGLLRSSPLVEFRQVVNQYVSWA
jgi:hypothetical protein